MALADRLGLDRAAAQAVRVEERLERARTSSGGRSRAAASSGVSTIAVTRRAEYAVASLEGRNLGRSAGSG